VIDNLNISWPHINDTETRKSIHKYHTPSVTTATFQTRISKGKP